MLEFTMIFMLFWFKSKTGHPLLPVSPGPLGICNAKSPSSNPPALTENQKYNNKMAFNLQYTYLTIFYSYLKILGKLCLL